MTMAFVRHVLLCLFMMKYVLAQAAPAEMPLCHGFKLEEASIDSIQRELRAKRLTSVQLVECYIERIKVIQPLTNALLELNPDVLEIAAQMDKERAEGKVCGPLHGIPIVVKDNIASKDKLNTTAGSWALFKSIVPRDAHVVALLRKAGAILLGKSNLSEFADFRANIYYEGWSGRGGQTHNAYVLPGNPGGSSSGSGVMVGANMVTVALGTETDGSVISPSSRNMLAGIKPTVGLTSRDGVIPLAHSQDTVGCMGKTLRDAVLVLDAIKGVDPRDPATLASKGRFPKSYLHYLRKGALKGARLGVPRKIMWQAPSTKLQLPVLEEALDIMRAAGATIVDPTDIPSIDQLANVTTWTWMPNEYTVCLYEFKDQINTYLSELLYSPVRSLQDIINFNSAHPDLELPSPWNPYQDILIASQATRGGLKNPRYLEALRENQLNARQRGIDAVLKAHNLDALILPADPNAAVTQPAADAGYPLVTIPVGIDREGVPFGILFSGTAYSEPTLIKLAYAFEQLTKRRVVPKFLPKCQYSNTTGADSC